MSLTHSFIGNIAMRAGRPIQVNQSDAMAACNEFYDGNMMPKVVPSSELRKLDTDLLRTLFHIGGMYVWPTEELCQYIKNQCLVHDNPLEIGAGNGVLSKTIGVTATDSYMQSLSFAPKTNREAMIHRSALESYAAMRVPLVNYGSNVLLADAKDAVRSYSPDFIYGLFVTHKTPASGNSGNMLGIDEQWILDRTKTKKYMVIGNEITHKDKPLLLKHHRREYFDWLVTRSEHQNLNRIFIWEK